MTFDQSNLLQSYQMHCPFFASPQSISGKIATFLSINPICISPPAKSQPFRPRPYCMMSIAVGETAIDTVTLHRDPHGGNLLRRIRPMPGSTIGTTR